MARVNETLPFVITLYVIAYREHLGLKLGGPA